jgi:hypothetical protein
VSPIQGYYRADGKAPKGYLNPCGAFTAARSLNSFSNDIQKVRGEVDRLISYGVNNN